MKKIKLITYIFIVLLGFIINGELYVWNISEFQYNYPNTTFYIQKNTNEDEMIKDILNMSKKYNVDIFTTVNKVENIFNQNLKIFATEKAIYTLEQNNNIKNGTFKSILLGEVNLEILSFEKISNIKNITDYYLIGDKENIVEFKRSLVNKYAGKFPMFPKIKIDETKFIVIVIWVVIFFSILLMTLYEIVLNKKEVITKIIFGKNINFIVTKNIFIDSMFFVTTMYLIRNILSKYTNSFYLKTNINICFIGFLILNSLLYLLLYNINFKKDVVLNFGAKKILFLSYIFKIFTFIIVIVLMTLNLSLIYKSIEFYKQKSFFEENKDKYYVSIYNKYEDIEYDKNLIGNFYKTFSENKKAFTLNKYNNDIFANSNSIIYLKENIEELSNFQFDEKIYFIIPSENNMPETVDLLKRNFEVYYTNENYDYEVITYNTNVELIAIEKIDKINNKIIKNPNIILNNLQNISLEDFWDTSILSISQSTLYSLTKEEIELYIKELKDESIEYYITNIYETYLYEWKILQRNMYIGFIFIIMFLIFEILVIRTILNFEYNINAKELSLKKILGYSTFSRYKNLINITITIFVLSLIVIVILNIFFQLNLNFISIIISSFIILLFEIFIICLNVRKIEKHKIQRILKGEYL